MDDDFVKQRLKRDLAELKRMCDDHFQLRREDDDKITDLEGRIAKTRSKREESKTIRQQKEDEKNAKLELMKQQHAEQEAAKAATQKARQAEILTAMAGGYDKEAARARRGEKRRLKRRSNVFGKKSE